MALFDKKTETKKETASVKKKAPAAKAKKAATSKPSQPKAKKAPVAKKPTPVAQPKKSLEEQVAIAEQKITKLVAELEPLCKKGAGLDGTARRGHKINFTALAKKLIGLCA